MSFFHYNKSLKEFSKEANGIIGTISEVLLAEVTRESNFLEGYWI